MSPSARRSPRAASSRAPAFPIPVAQPRTSVRIAIYRDSDRVAKKVLNSRARPPIQRDVSEQPITPAAPAAGDVVAIVNPLSGHPVTAVVERAGGRPYVLPLHPPAILPTHAHVRWFAGGT